MTYTLRFRLGWIAALLLCGGADSELQRVIARQERQFDTSRPAFRISTELVQFDAVVLDSEGQTVSTLTRDDFDVRQDGTPVALKDATFIDRSARQRSLDEDSTRTPRLGIDVEPLVFLIDDMAMTPDGFRRVIEALRQFLTGGVPPGLEVGILRTGETGRRTTALTRDSGSLLKRLDEMRYLARSFRPGLASGSGAAGPGTRDLERTFTEGTLGSLNSLLVDLRRFPGRKTAVLLSEGVALTPGEGQGLEWRLNRLAQLAAEAGVTTHTIDVSGVSAGAASLAAAMILRDGLVSLPDRMAGLYLGLSNDLIAPLRRIVEFERGYYLLTYEPPDGTFVAAKDPPFRRLSVRARGSGLHVRTRAGFFARR